MDVYTTRAHTYTARTRAQTHVSPHRERRESSRSLSVGERVSEFIDWLPPRGWLARSPGLSLLYSTPLSTPPRSPLALCLASPSFSLSDCKSLSFCLYLFLVAHPCRVFSSHVHSPRVCLLPFDYFPGHLRILRTSRLPQVLYLLRLATLVSAWLTHTYTRIGAHKYIRVHSCLDVHAEARSL